jgi:hypothetical protein
MQVTLQLDFQLNSRYCVRKVGSLPKKLLIVRKCFCTGGMPSCTYILKMERTVSGLKAAKHCLSLLCGGSAERDVKFTHACTHMHDCSSVFNVELFKCF